MRFLSAKTIIVIVLLLLLSACSKSSSEPSIEQLKKHSIKIKEKFLFTADEIEKAKNIKDVEKVIVELSNFQKIWIKDHFIGCAKLLAEDPSQKALNKFLIFMDKELLVIITSIKKTLLNFKGNYPINNLKSPIERYYNICIGLPEVSFKDIDPIFNETIGYTPAFKAY